ncbi:MAG: RIP metalloprotease RseP, partial [Chloroflexi bacterium]
MNWLIWGASVVVMFLLLIAPHEGGHFALAKLFKVRVIEFSLGMGSKLWSGTAGGTVYALRALPIGGFVRLGGMEPGDYSDPAGFHFKPAWQRILILLGGPAVNFLVAIVIATAIAAPAIFIQPGTVTGLIVPSPAYSAGIRPGDRILSIDGHPVRQPTDI